MAKWGEIKCPRCEELEAKLAQQDDLVQAAVAAALREAAKMLEETVGDLANPEHAKAVYVASQAILALITPDAQAALDRVKAAERERCANVAESFGCCHVPQEIAAAIREGGE